MPVETAIKIAVILVLYPLWAPVAKAMWRELEGSMRREGGLFGNPPSAKELKKLNEKHGPYSFPLVQEPWAHLRGQRGKAKPAAGTGERRGKTARRPPGGGSRVQPTRRSGF